MKNEIYNIHDKFIADAAKENSDHSTLAEEYSKNINELQDDNKTLHRIICYKNIVRKLSLSEDSSILQDYKEKLNEKQGQLVLDFKTLDGMISQGKFSIELVAEASVRLTAENKLTDAAKAEAKQVGFSELAYQKFLIQLAMPAILTATNLQDQILHDYQNARKSIEDLVKEGNINLLVSRYSSIKEKISIKDLILLNPGSENEIENDNGKIVGVISRKTTFAHALFENGASREDIKYFFAELNNLVRQNAELVHSYLNLANTDGESIYHILEGAKYQDLYQEMQIKYKYRDLFPTKTREIIIDTHTASIHSSVDKSLVKLAKIYIGQNVDNKAIEIDRTEAWNKRINKDIDELFARLESLETEEQIRSFLFPQLEVNSLLSGNQEEEIKNFQFQINAAKRMVEGLQSKWYGYHYAVNSNDVQNGSGLTPKEIVAIGYKSLEDRDNWNNPEQKKEHFASFVRNLYEAKRGYNIDDYGENEWKTNPQEPDRNKCTGGTINQIAEGLKDHKFVEVKIITTETMSPILDKKLIPILEAIAIEELGKKLIENWLQASVIKAELSNKIIERLKNDEGFKNQFSEDEISRIGNQVLQKTNTKQLAKTLSEIENFKDLTSSHDYKQFICSFAFDIKRGYVPYLESLYSSNSEKFTELFGNEIKSSLLDNIDSDSARKTSTITELLLRSKNVDLTEKTKEILQDAFKNADPTLKDEHFFLSSKRGNTHLLIELLDIGADIEAKDNYGNTALINAAWLGHTEMVKLLLGRGADVNAKSIYGYTALMNARHTEMVKLLLGKGADVNAKNNSGDTALINAASIVCTERTELTEIIKLLLDKGAKVNVVNNMGDTALINAARHGHTEMVKLLLDRGAKVNVVNNMGYTALMNAARHGHTEKVKLLLDRGADVNAVSIYGDTALINAAWLGHTEMVKLLLDRGAKVNARNIYGDTALINAASNECTERTELTEMVKLLLDKGAKVNARNIYGHTALIIFAARHGHTENIELLLDRGADVNAVSICGETALKNAELRGHTENIELLLKRSDNNIELMTPVHMLIKFKYVKTIISHKLDKYQLVAIDKQPPHKISAYLLTASYSIKEVVEALPMIKYAMVNMLGMDKNYWPSLLDNNYFKFGAHYAATNAAIYEVYGSIDPEYSLTFTSLYGTKILASEHFASVREANFAKSGAEKITGIVELVEKCGYDILSQSILGGISGWLTASPVAVYGAVQGAAMGSMQCYNQYQELSNLKNGKDTTNNLVENSVAYTLDAVSLYLFAQNMHVDLSSNIGQIMSINQLFAGLSAIVTTDYLSRACIKALLNAVGDINFAGEAQTHHHDEF